MMEYKENKNYCVYLHTNRINSKKYVGITKRNPESRWRNGKGYKDNIHFWNAICLYSWDAFDHEILYTGLSIEDAKQKEIDLISYYKCNDPLFGYNKTLGGDNIYKITDEIREKMRVAKIGVYDGENNPMFGISPRERMSPEVYNGWLQKRGCHDCSNICKPVVCYNTGEIFQSMTEAGKKYGVCSGDIGSCCSGKLCSAGYDKKNKTPFVWMYLEDYKNNKKPKENCAYRKIVCLNTMEIFDRIIDAANKYHICAPNITLCCQGIYSYAGKLNGNPIVWQYYNDYLNGVSPRTPKAISTPVYCVTTGERFNTIAQAANYYGIVSGGIRNCCNGKYKYSGKTADGRKLIWRYDHAST